MKFPMRNVRLPQRSQKFEGGITMRVPKPKKRHIYKNIILANNDGGAGGYLSVLHEKQNE